MRPIASQRRVSLLIAAALLSNSVAPPGIYHSHAGGDRPHRHDWLADDDHAHRLGHFEVHDQGQRHGHGNQANSAILDGETDGLDPPIDHVHFAWFGLTWSMSAPTQPGKHRQSNEGAAPGIVQPFKDQVATFKPLVDFAAHLFFETRASPIEPAVPMKDRFSSRPAPCDHLCDTARHERSGVQIV